LTLAESSFSLGSFIILIAIAVILLGLIGVAFLAVIYNRLVRGRLLVREGFSGIDVQLKRRHDLIPNLVKVVKGYADFEKETLERVTQLRSQAAGGHTMDERETAENELSSALKSLLMIAEAYPNLKADAQFLDLQKRLAEIENYLEKSRRYYNGTVREYNTTVQSFPSNMVAGMFRFPTEPFFQLDQVSERDAPQVNIND
jgi:LemA protein